MASSQRIAKLVQAGVEHFKAGRYARAEAILLEAVAKDAQQHGALHLLGVLALREGRHGVAIERWQQALMLAPAFPPYLSNLGEAQRRAGNFPSAIELLQLALAAAPELVEAHHNLGMAFRELQAWGQAAECFEAAIALQPSLLESQRKLGEALRRLGRLDAALAALQVATKLAPDHAPTHAELGLVWKDLGKAERAVDSLRRAVELDPSARGVHGNLVYTLAFDARATSTQILAEAQAWASRHALSPAERPEPRNPTTSRKLRVGYVSPDFCDHVQAHFCLPLFAHQDRSVFELYAYSNVRSPDAITERVRSAVDAFRDISRLDDEQACALIRADEIDILIDLTMHMMENRLPLFARRPAPVQATWLAYPGTTGLSAIDYRLTDPYLDPPELDTATYAEQSLRLRDTFWCYAPLEVGIEPGELPAQRNGYVTFGCLNNACKLSSSTLELWAQVLSALPDSHLLLLAPEGDTRRELMRTLAALGVARARVHFADYGPRRAYLEQYGQIDIALDTLPYNGHTTSIDALWMGVPVVTLVGSTVVGRAGLSQMTNLQLQELVAESPRAFVDIARTLGGDLPRLAELRGSLRARLEASPLMDARRFAESFDACLREMWRRAG